MFLQYCQLMLVAAQRRLVSSDSQNVARSDLVVVAFNLLLI
jgi:hypothetical protein